jgi:hypothetical protein
MAGATAAADTNAGTTAVVGPGRRRGSLEEERHHQRQRLLLLLLERFCYAYGQDPERSRQLYLHLCKQLVRAGVRTTPMEWR